MRKLGLLAIAGAGVGFFLCTEQGRTLMRRCGEAIQDGYRRLSDYRAQREVEELVEKAVEQPHPDTAVARAFEEAVTG